MIKRFMIVGLDAQYFNGLSLVMNMSVT